MNFNLLREEPSTKKYDGTPLPGPEVTRREAINKLRGLVKLLINGKYVAESRESKV